MSNLINFEEIRPKEFDLSDVRLALLAELNSVSMQVISEFNKTTVYWKSGRPKFSRKLHTNIDGKREKIGFSISTDNSLWNYLDKGVKPRIIPPITDRVAGTSGTYVPGSMPGTLSVRKMGVGKQQDGNYLSLNQTIHWPGIEARGFSKLIQEKLGSKQFDLRGRLQAVLNKSSETVWK